jgi:hypothetical protein
MALLSEGRKIFMNEGDYGIDLPFTITKFDFEPNDKMLFTVSRSNGSSKIVEKEYTNLTGDMKQFSFALSFTKEESNKLPKGVYEYSIVFLREDANIRSTIVSNEEFRVGDVV